MRKVALNAPRSTIAYDSDRGRLVLFDGRQGAAFTTWERDPSIVTSVWQPCTPVTSPPWRLNSAMAYDAARKKTILHGGSTDPLNNPNVTALNDTWAWDGRNWTQVAAGFQGRHSHVMVYDSARQRVVCGPGIYTYEQLMPYCQEWDGTAWTQPLVTIPLRARYGMAYDAGRGVTVVFGGDLAGQLLNDTWEWNGTTWSQITSATTPPVARSRHAMASLDPFPHVFLHGGRDANSVLGDTWRWDGTGWLDMNAGTAAREDHSMTTLNSTFPVIAAYGGPTDDAVWLLDVQASVWNAQFHPAAPLTQHSAAAAFDSLRQRTVLTCRSPALGFDTWEWDGMRWALTSQSGPVLREGQCVAFDSARGRTVMFGGGNASGLLGDTQEWDGTAWSLSTPVPSPAPRQDAAMAYDAARQVTVLFSGQQATSVADTWTWNGTNWTQRFPASSPSARQGHTIVNDASRARAVLFGGRDTAFPFQVRDDTWEWDGTTWTQATVSPPLRPPARHGHSACYDSVRARTVITGGANVGELGDTWEWDGTTWTSTGAGAPTQTNATMVYDSVLRRGLMFGGLQGGNGNNDTWIYGVTQPATVQSVGVSCRYGGSMRALGAAVVGDQRFAFDLVGAQPGSTVAVMVCANPVTPYVFLGCTIYVDLNALLFTLYGSTNAIRFSSIALPIPPSPSLFGVSLYTQAMVVDPANPSVLATSQSLILTFGD